MLTFWNKSKFVNPKSEIVFMSIDRKVQTLDEFTIQQLRNFPVPPVNCRPLTKRWPGCKRVNVEVNKAGWWIFGRSWHHQCTGRVKKLDVYANNQFVGVLRHGISYCRYWQRGNWWCGDIWWWISNASKYVCLFDPLDGSANIDVNVPSVPSSVFTAGLARWARRPLKWFFTNRVSTRVAAGYVIYGFIHHDGIYHLPRVNGFTWIPPLVNLLKPPQYQMPWNRQNLLCEPR